MWKLLQDKSRTKHIHTLFESWVHTKIHRKKHFHLIPNLLNNMFLFGLSRTLKINIQISPVVLKWCAADRTRFHFYLFHIGLLEHVHFLLWCNFEHNYLLGWYQLTTKKIVIRVIGMNYVTTSVLSRILITLDVLWYFYELFSFKN